jgi:thiamine biosynthesis lipoprotein
VKKINITVLSIALLGLLISCAQEKKLTIEGRAQGTTYQITYLSKQDVVSKEQIDTLLKQLDRSLSTYVPSSIISRINRNDSNVVVDEYFSVVLNKAMEVSEKTQGLFDITVAPIVNLYGFGFTKKANVSKAAVDSLLQFVGYKMVRLAGNKLVKERPGVMLDFNAIAQGYSVDVLASYLDRKGINNYLVELGGEVKAKGTKENKEPWRIGIDQPTESFGSERNFQAVVTLKDMAMATSGNYRRYYEENGQKYAHIISPRTGYPEQNNLLSATVFASDCMTADAYATAFMVMGVQKARQFLATHKDLNLEVFFIYDEMDSWQTYRSERLNEWIVK